MGKVCASLKRVLAGMIVVAIIVTNMPAKAYAAEVVEQDSTVTSNSETETLDDAIASDSQNGGGEQETDPANEENIDSPDDAGSGNTSGEVKEPSKEENPDEASSDAPNGDEEGTTGEDGSDETLEEESEEEPDEELSDEELLDEELLDEELLEEELLGNSSLMSSDPKDAKLLAAGGDYVYFDGSIGDELNNYHFDYHDFNGKRVCVLDNAGHYKMRGYEFETGARAGLYYQGDLILVLRGDNDIAMQYIDGGDNRQSYGIYVTGKLTLIASGNATLKVSSAQANGISCGIYAGSIEMPKSSPVSGTFNFPDYTGTPSVKLGSCSASGLTINASHGGGAASYIYAVNTRNAASTIEAGTLNLSGMRGFNSNYTLTVTGGKVNSTAPLMVSNLTVKGGSVKADLSGSTTSLASSNGIETNVLTVTGGSVEGRSLKGLSMTSGIQCNTLNISGGNIYAYGYVNTSSTLSPTTNPFVQGILTTSVNMTGGSIIAYGGNIGSTKVQGAAIRIRDNGETHNFSGGTVEAYGGTIDSSNTDGSSYGICGGSQRIVLSGTKLTARGYTNAFGKTTQESLDAGCIVVGTGTTASNLKPLGYGSHNYSELKQYKYLIAGTEAQMKAINSSYVPQKRDISESVIYLDGDYASNKSYYYTGKTETVNVTVKLAGADITSLVKFSANTGTSLSGGKPTYLNAGTFTLTATANDSRYTGSASCKLNVRGMTLDSLSASVTSGAVTYNGSDDFSKYSSVKVNVTGTKSSTTYTLADSEYEMFFGTLDTSSATSAVAGTVPITIRTKSGANHGYSGSAKTTLTVNKAASTMTLSQSSVSTFTGNRINLSSYVKNSQGTLSYAISQSLTGCSLNGSTLTCGSTTGTCKVTITDAGSTYYKSGSKTITISVASKPAGNLTVSMENVKKTGKTEFVGITSGTTGSAIPDPTFTKQSGATDIKYTYSGTKYDNSAYAATSSKPTVPGKYTVAVSYHTDSADYSGSAEFYIKGDLSSQFITNLSLYRPGASYAIYSGSEIAVDILRCVSTDGNLTNGTHYKFKSGEKGTDAGTYTAVLEPASVYFTGERNFNWTITKRNPDGNDFVVPAHGDFTYDGTVKGISTPKLAGNMTGCGDISVYYMLDDTTRVDKPINAGDYFVYANVSGGKNFNAAEGIYLYDIVYIRKAPDPVKIPDNASVTVGGNTVDLSKLVTGNIGKVTYELDDYGRDHYGCSIDPDTGILTSGNITGAINVLVRVAETANYAGESKYIYVSITDKVKKPLTVKQSNGTFGSVVSDPVYTKPSGTLNTTVSYTGFDYNGYYYESNLKPSTTGTYTVRVSCETKSEMYEGTAEFSINPKDIAKAEISFNEDTLTYDGSTQYVSLNSVKLGTVALGENIDYSIVSGYDAADAGRYTLKISGIGNYTGEATAQWTIEKRVPTRDCFYFQTDWYEFNYDGYEKTVYWPILNNLYYGCGDITVYYEREGYERTTKAPIEAGLYSVTFDVAEGTNFTAATGLVYCDFIINRVWHDSVDVAIDVMAGAETAYDLSPYIEPGGSVNGLYIVYGSEYVASYIVKDNKLLITFGKDAPEGASAKFAMTVDDCNNYQSYAISVTAIYTHEHQLTKVPAKAATCEEPGNIEYYVCNIDGCGALFADKEGLNPIASYEDTIIPALGHDFGEWKVTRKPTDKETGVRTRTCKRCKHTETEELPTIVIPGKVVIDDGGADYVYTGETLKLTATVTATVEGKDASQEVIWTSSNAKVAQVNEEGVVTGIANGSVTITAAAVDKPSVKATVKLLVRTRITDLKLVLPTANLPDDTNTNAGRLQVGKSMTVSAVFNNGVDKADRGLVWYSEDSTVAAVNQKGVITAKASSDEPVMITAVSIVDETRMATCYVTVYDPVTSVKLNKTAITLGVGETYKGLTVSFAPVNASVQDWIPTYPTDGIIEVERVTVNGVDCLQVKGLKPGKTKITVKATDGSNKSAVCNVTVGNAVSSVSIAAPKNVDTLAAGKTLKFTPTFNGGDKKNQPVNKDIEWKITSELDREGLAANGKIATIDQKGTLKGLSAGTVKVSAVHTESGISSQEYEVRIFVPMTKLTISETKVTVSEIKGSYQLSATVTSDQATWHDGTNAVLTKDTLEWEVVKSDLGQDGEQIIKVDETGKFTIGKLPEGKTKATATIKVTAKSDSGNESKPTVKTAQCVVTVVKQVKVSKITLSSTKISAGVGSVYKLNATVAPYSVDNSDVEWISSDPASVQVNGDGATAQVIVNAVPANNKPVTITVTATDGSKKSAKCTITVGNPVKENGVAITQTEAQKRLIVGKTTTLKSVVTCDTSENAKAKPANAAVTWEITKAWDADNKPVADDKLSTIATITNKGVVKAGSCGRVEITATSKETPASGTPAKASVQIVTYVPVTKLAISQTKRSIGEGKTGYLWVSTVTPVNAFDPEDPEGTINWTVSDESAVALAAYEPGKTPVWGTTASTVKGQKLIFKALKQTKKAVTIKGTAIDGSKTSVSCQLTILGSVKEEDVKLMITKKSVAAALQKNITVSPAYDTASKSITVNGLPIGKTVKIVPQITATAADKTVTYRSNNSYVATVNASGVITAKHSGTAVITMTTSDSGKIATCIVTIP